MDDTTPASHSNTSTNQSLTPENFFRLFCRDVAGVLFCLIWPDGRDVPADKRRKPKHIFLPWDVGLREMAKIQQQDPEVSVYYTIGITDGSGKRKEANMVSPRALTQDLDRPDCSAEVAKYWMASPFPPNAIIETSPGKLQLLWWITPDLDWPTWTRMQRGLIAMVNARFGEGAADASIIDPPRVFRVPCSLHRKPGKPETRGRILHLSEGELELMDLVRFQKFLPMPAVEAPRVKREWRPEEVGAYDAKFEDLLGHIEVLHDVPDGYDVVCPNAAEHTEEGKEDARLYYPAEKNEWKGGFSCYHQHCKDRMGKNQIGWVYQWQEAGYPEDPDLVRWGSAAAGAEEFQDLTAEVPAGSGAAAKPLAPMSEAQRAQQVTLAPSFRNLLLSKLAFVMAKGVPNVLVTDSLPAIPKGTVMGVHNAKEALSDIKILVKPGEGEKQPKEKSAFEAWKEDRNRVKLDGVNMFPEEAPLTIVEDEGSKIWNTWRGFATEPAGDPEKARPWFEFLDLFFEPPPDADAEQIQENARMKDRFLKWAAHLMQRPHLHQKTSWSFISGMQGVGKSGLLESLAYVIGLEEGAYVAGAEIAGTKFNSALDGKIFVVVNEMNNKNPAVGERIKHLRTAPKLHLETKFGAKYDVDNHVMWSFTGNGESPFHIDADARRDWIFSPWLRERGSPEFDLLEAKSREFKGLYCGDRQTNGKTGRDAAKAYRAALLAALLKVDLSDYDHTAGAENSAAKLVAVEASTDVQDAEAGALFEILMSSMGLRQSIFWDPKEFADWYRFKTGRTNATLGEFVTLKRKLRGPVQKHGMYCGKFLIREGDAVKRVWGVSREPFRMLNSDKVKQHLWSQFDDEGRPGAPSLSVVKD